MSDIVDPADQYDHDAAEFMAHFARFVTEGFGVRCEEFDAGCATCRMWRLYDQAHDIAVFVDADEKTTP